MYARIRRSVLCDWIVSSGWYIWLLVLQRHGGVYMVVCCFLLVLWLLSFCLNQHPKAAQSIQTTLNQFHHWIEYGGWWWYDGTWWSYTFHVRASERELNRRSRRRKMAIWEPSVVYQCLYYSVLFTRPLLQHTTSTTTVVVLLILILLSVFHSSPSNHVCASTTVLLLLLL